MCLFGWIGKKSTPKKGDEICLLACNSNCRLSWPAASQAASGPKFAPSNWLPGQQQSITPSSWASEAGRSRRGLRKLRHRKGGSLPKGANGMAHEAACVLLRVCIWMRFCAVLELPPIPTPPHRPASGLPERLPRQLLLQLHRGRRGAQLRVHRPAVLLRGLHLQGVERLMGGGRGGVMRHTHHALAVGGHRQYKELVEARRLKLHSESVGPSPEQLLRSLRVLELNHWCQQSKEPLRWEEIWGRQLGKRSGPNKKKTRTNNLSPACRIRES